KTPPPVTTTRAVDTLPLVPRQAKRRVITAECIGVVQDHARVRLASPVRNIIEVAFRVGFLVIDRGRYPAGVKGHGAGSGFDRTGGAHGVAEHRLDGADGNLTGAVSEERADGQALHPVIRGSASAVGTDVIDSLYSDRALFHGGLHGTDGPVALG